MDKPTPIPISKSVRAAQYVRMSTEHQQYSTENQAEVIARYAAEHGMEIVATYEDSGKSGLTLTGREELKKLLADAESGSADFSVVLVYDVSRWGRFLDADESAYHEYVCKRAGVSVHYPAEQFKNDGSPISTLIKAVNRRVLSRYLSTWLQSARVIELTSLKAVQTAQPNLSMADLGNFVIPVPSLTEQCEIMGRLESECAPITAKIIAAEREIGLAREYRTRLTADVVTGKLDVRGLELPEIEVEEALELLSEAEDEETEETEEMVAAGEGGDAD